MQKSMGFFLMCVASVGLCGQSTGRQVTSVGCQVSTGICRATFDATLATATTSRKCGGNGIKWHSDYSDGAILTQELEKAVVNRRYVAVSWDDNKCFDADATTLSLTNISIDLSKAGY